MRVLYVFFENIFQFSFVTELDDQFKVYDTKGDNIEVVSRYLSHGKW